MPRSQDRHRRRPLRSHNRDMSTVQKNGRGTGGVTGKGFMPGRSGNPGGRPQGLARATRELVGEDGMALARLWWDIARDETRRDSDRLEASRLLADRGWGKAPTYAAIEDPDPLDRANLEAAARSFERGFCVWSIGRTRPRRSRQTGPRNPCVHPRCTPSVDLLLICRSVRGQHGLMPARWYARSHGDRFAARRRHPSPRW